MTLAYTLSGLLVGLLVGLTGVGGGSLMTPLLTLMFGFSPATAVGTDLAFASLTKSVGTIAHRNHGHVRWDIVKLLCLGSVPAALVTVAVLKMAGNLDVRWMHIIRVTIGVSVILTVVSVLFRQRVLGWLARNPRYRLQGFGPGYRHGHDRFGAGRAGDGVLHRRGRRGRDADPHPVS